MERSSCCAVSLPLLMLFDTDARDGQYPGGRGGFLEVT